MNKEQLNQKLRNGNDQVLGILIIITSIIIFIGIIPTILSSLGYLVFSSIALGIVGIFICQDMLDNCKFCQ